MEIKNHICSDHAEVQYIEEYHIPMEIAGHKLGGNATQIADVHQDQKYQAFAFVGLVLNRGNDVVGPAAAKTEEHEDL